MQLPSDLRKFIENGGVTFHCEDGDWDIDVRAAEDSDFKKELPKGAVMIAENGSGDCLFLKRGADGKAADKVFVFWHEENRSEMYTPKTSELLKAPPQKAPEPSKKKPMTSVSLTELKKALNSRDDSLARVEALRRFKEGAFGIEALQTLREALMDDQVMLVLEAAECIGKLGPAAREAAEDDNFNLEFQLFVVGSKVWSYSLCANAYSACLAALLKIEADEDLIVDYIRHNVGANDGEELIDSLQALKDIGSKEAIGLLKRAAVFWMPELNARNRKHVEQLAKG